MQFPGMRAGGLLPCISFVTQLGLYYYPHFSEKENKPQRGSDLPDITQHVAGTHLRVARHQCPCQGPAGARTGAERSHACPLGKLAAAPHWPAAHSRPQPDQERPTLSEFPVRPSSTHSRDGWMPHQQVGVSLTRKKFIRRPRGRPATVPASYRTAQRSRATGHVSNGNGTMITLASRRAVLTLGLVSRHHMAQSLNPQGKSGRWASCTYLLLERSSLTSASR